MANDRVSGELQKRQDAQTETTATWEQILAKYQPDFQQAMPRGKDAVQMVRDALHCLRTTKGLAQCSRESVMGGLMTCSQLGLRPGVSNLGEAWLVPFAGQATLIVGYRGYIKLAYNSPRVTAITGRPVHEREPFEYTQAPTHLRHGWAGWDVEIGPVVGYYAHAVLDSGGEVAWAWGEKTAEAHRQQIITARGFRGGPWKDWPTEMKVKHCVLRMKNYLPTSLELESASASDGAVRTDPSPDVRPEDASTVIDGDVVDEFDDNPLHGQSDE